MNSRQTFVLWISREGDGDAKDVVLAARLEEADTGVEQRFQSAEQLIEYLQESLRHHQENPDE